VRTEEMVSLELGLKPTPQPKSQPVPGPTCTPVETTDSHRELRAVVQAAATYYAAQPIPGWVKPYCTERGADLDKLPHGAGYAPSGWRNLTDHLREADFTDEQLLASGLVSRSTRGELIDRMRDRLVLPIRDERGPVAFIGRAVPDSDAPKWLNTSDSALFTKGGLFYGLADSAQALRAGATPVVVEGPFDAAAVNSVGGGRYVGVAPLGTALTQRHVQALVEAVGSGADIIVGFDADTAGTAAAVRSYDLLAPHTDRARQLTLPDGNDPADFLAAHGPAALRSALDDANLLVEQVVEARIRPWDSKLRFAEGRIGALREAAPLIAALPPEQVPGQVHRLMQRLDLAHETVIDAIVEAIPNITSAATTAPLQARRRRDVDVERAQSRATRSHANPHEPRPGIGI
jgi:DNA primase catalytic core